MIPSGFLYIDRTLPPGSREPNGVTQLEVFWHYQLNTPPPVMSTITDSRPGLDLFRARPHPTRDLGSQMWTWDSLSSFRPTTAQGHILEVIQMSAEEDEAITSLLKLHYQSELEITSSDPRGNMIGEDPTAVNHQSLRQPTPTPPSQSDAGPASNSVEDLMPPPSFLACQSTQGSDAVTETLSVGNFVKDQRILSQGAVGNHETERLHCFLPADQDVLAINYEKPEERPLMEGL